MLLLAHALVDHIVFSPEEGNPKRATLDLHGGFSPVSQAKPENSRRIARINAAGCVRTRALSPLPPYSGFVSRRLPSVRPLHALLLQVLRAD
jgi:hypothetical protein